MSGGGSAAASYVYAAALVDAGVRLVLGSMPGLMRCAARARAARKGMGLGCNSKGGTRPTVSAPAARRARTPAAE